MVVTVYSSLTQSPNSHAYIPPPHFLLREDPVHGIPIRLLSNKPVLELARCNLKKLQLPSQNTGCGCPAAHPVGPITHQLDLSHPWPLISTHPGTGYIQSAMCYSNLHTSNLLLTPQKPHQEYQKAPGRSLSGVSFHPQGLPGTLSPKQHLDRNFTWKHPNPPPTMPHCTQQ